MITGTVVEKSHGWFKVKLNGTDELANVRGGDLRVLPSGSSSLTSAVTPAKPGKAGVRSRSPPASVGRTISGEYNAKAPQGTRRKSMFPGVSIPGAKPTTETSSTDALHARSSPQSSKAGTKVISDPVSAEDSGVGDSTKRSTFREAGVSEEEGERTPGRRRRVSSKSSSEEPSSPSVDGKVRVSEARIFVFPVNP